MVTASGVICLEVCTAGDVVGVACIDLCEEDSQIIIHEVAPKNHVCPVPSLSAALRSAIHELLARKYKSATAWPSSVDERMSDILEGAGFKRTGLFMRRSAFSEEGHIEFNSPSSSVLDKFLDAHARRVADETAKHTLHDPEKIYIHVRQDYNARFRNGLSSDDETILSICDAATREIVGSVWVSFRQEGSDRAAFIEEIEILKSKRKRGHGTKAIKALGNSSFGRSIDVVSLFVQPENVPAYALYKKLKFEPGRFEYVYRQQSAQQAGPPDALDAGDL
jgi:ribosomal protein S18 acetylase RimI-like enzyme